MKNNKIYFITIGIIFFLCIWSTFLFAGDDSIQADNIKIVIKETSLVSNSNIYLKDISTIYANGILKEALEKIEIGPSPKPDKIKSFDEKKILFTIKRHKYLPENINIKSPERIWVKRQSQKILKKDIRQIIDQQLSRLFENNEYQLKAFSVRGLEPYPMGKVRFSLDSNDMVDKNGKLSCYLDILIDGTKEDRVSVSGIVAVYEDILYTARPYAKGETISKNDIYKEKQNIFDINENYIKTFEEVSGKVLKSNINKGDRLSTRLLEAPPLVQKGEIIKLVSKNANLMIVTSAISKENGFKNDVIKVENLTSGKLVRGVVKGKSKVEVVN